MIGNSPIYLNIHQRSTQKELLDEDEAIDVKVLVQNLKEFTILNKYLGTRSNLIQALNKIHDVFRQDNDIHSKNKKLSILDLGSGAGDLLIEMNRWAIRKNITVDLIGIDNNPFIVDYSKKKVERYDNISIDHADLLSLSSYFSNRNNVDIVCLNNVLHHLTDEQILNLLELLSLKTNLAIIINDLRREIIPFYTIKWLTKWMKMSTFAQHDGPLSVLKAFKEQDFKKYFSTLNIKHFEIHKSWAYRWQVIIYLK